MNFQDVVSVYKKYLYLEDDIDFLPVIYGTVLANRLDNVKVWVFVMGPSSSGKTEILMSLSECSDIFRIDSVTEKSFISHFRGPRGKSPDPSLLPKFNKKTVIIKDMSPISEMHPNARSQIFSTLRSAYDGKYRRGTGLADTDIESWFGLIGGCTPAFERARTFETALGERFLYFRPRLKRKDLALKKSRSHVGSLTKMQEDLQRTAKQFLDNKLMGDLNTKPSIMNKIDEYSDFVVRLRNAVMRDYKGDIEFPIMESEMPFRLSNVIIGLYHGLRELELDETQVFRTIRRVLSDSCPITRSCVLYLIGQEGKLDANELSQLTGMSKSYIYRILYELEHMQFIKEDRSDYSLRKEIEPIVRELFDEFPPTDLFVIKYKKVICQKCGLTVLKCKC